MKNPLNDNKGNFSSTRVGMMLCVMSGCYIAIAGLHLGSNLLELAPMSLGLIGAGFTAKVSQKHAENNSSE